MDCQSISDVLALANSAFLSSRWVITIQHDGAVIFTEQRLGEQAGSGITIPRQTFLRMLSWYQEEQNM
jgi:hypothetical protein